MADPFDEWVRTANGGRKTTLRQQVELGVRLFVESLTEPPLLLSPFLEHPSSPPRCNQRDMVDKVIQLVEDTPFRREGLVSWQGIRVSWFLDTFCNSPFMRRVSDFGCEAWFVRKVCVIVMMVFGCFEYVGFDIDFGRPSSFVDSILSEPGSLFDAPSAQQPTIFLSYTGGYKWRHVVESLKQCPWDVMWMDILCVNQFAWTGSRRQEDESHNKFLDDLRDQIKTIGHTVLMLGAWDTVMETLSQIWVLWEVFVTSACGAELKPLLTKRQEVRFASSYKSLDQTQFLADIDANNANAEDDEDRESILTRMQGAGLDQVNEKVRGIMRAWLTWQCVRFKDEAAERQLRAATEGSQRQLGDTHPETRFWIFELARMQRKLGYTDKAELNLRNLLRTQRRVLGVRNLETRETMSILAAFLEVRKRYEEASRLFGELLQLQLGVLGSDHPRLAAFNLKRCLSRVDSSSSLHAMVYLSLSLGYGEL